MSTAFNCTQASPKPSRGWGSSQANRGVLLGGNTDTSLFVE